MITDVNKDSTILDVRKKVDGRNKYEELLY